MGFFGLFGGGKKEEPKKAAPAPVAVAPVVPAGTPAEHIAAISGAIAMVMNDDELVAAMAAAIKHAGGGIAVVRIQKPSRIWSQMGRSTLMQKCQDCF